VRGATIQNPQHLIQRLAKCRRERRLDIVGETISWAKCSTSGDRALAQHFATRVAQLCRMSREWSKSRAEWLGWERTHHLLN